MINVHSINSPEPTSGQGEMGNNLYFLHACLSPLWWRHWGKIHLPKDSDSTPVFPPSQDATTWRQSYHLRGTFGNLSFPHPSKHLLKINLSEEKKKHCHTEKIQAYSQWAEWSPYTHKSDLHISDTVPQASQRTLNSFRSSYYTHSFYPPCTSTSTQCEVNLMDLVSPVKEANHTLCIIKAAWFPPIKE